MLHIGINLQVVPIAEARIDPLDLGLHRGYAVFDYFPVREGRAWFLADYLRRFRASAQALGLHLPFADTDIVNHLQVLAEAENLQHGGCKLILTGGPSDDGYTPSEPRLYTYAFATKYGTSVAKTPDANAPPGGPPIRVNLLQHARDWPAVKTTNYVAALATQGRQLATGAAEILYHHNGYLTEASRSNLFLVTPRGELWTSPVESALRGITRHHVIAAARAAGMTVLERSMPVSALAGAAEIFLTGSGKGVLAVGQVEDRVIGDGGVGPVTARIVELYEARGRERAG